MTERFLDGYVELLCGDCLDIMPGIADNSIDACVTDPPYHLSSVVRRFSATSEADDTQTSERARNRADVYARSAVGFMSKIWDGGGISFDPETWIKVLRVLKPGGHLLAFGGTKTYHRLACAIEDAGFEIRDCIAWVYGQGFPKSHDVSKAIDRLNGAKRILLGTKVKPGARHSPGHEYETTPPATDAAKQWDGWGSALKPSIELIVVARKPLISTLAENVLKHGTGALNIDACRVFGEEETGSPRKYVVKRLKPGATLIRTGGNWRPDNPDAPRYEGKSKPGRWPVNLVHDGSNEVLSAFPESSSGSFNGHRNANKTRNVYGTFKGGSDSHPVQASKGSAARFFYHAKADEDDRLGALHPTIKPIDLIRWLIRLVTPLGGIVLDPFAGTGTTGEAAFREGMHAILIEREPEYQNDIRRRMKIVEKGTFARQVTRNISRSKPDLGPLFE